MSIENRIVRYQELKPCLDAFIDTRTPGSDKKENFTIIGPGVSENANQHVHISEAHGFNIGGARQPAGCLNSQHSHDTVEVFYVHSGKWRFMSGETATDGEVFLNPGDLISIPTKIFRGFENVGDDIGFLWAVLGKDDPGRVMWAPYVFDMAKEYGLVLLEDGTLVDTKAGETVPSNKKPMAVTTQAQIDALTIADNTMMENIVVRSDKTQPDGAFSALDGIAERQLIGPAPLDWDHEFTVSEIHLDAGADIPTHHLNVADVWFIQSGAIDMDIDGDTAKAGPGDTITIPKGQHRSLRAGAAGANVVMVRGGTATPKIYWS